MYYHLLDADWASNALSWQWVAGSNANKKYYANQENINKYCYSDQYGSYLDVEYGAFETLPIPPALSDTVIPDLTTQLPQTSKPRLDASLPTYVYNFYNMDPDWGTSADANRILLFEPSVFKKYPISDESLDFLLSLKNNIPDIQVFTGEFADFAALCTSSNIHFKEHPLNIAYKGIEEPRDWISGVTGSFSSFFAFWKRVKKQLS